MDNPIDTTTRTDNLHAATDATTATESYMAEDLIPDPPAIVMDPLAELEQLLVEMKTEDRATARKQNRIEEERIREQAAQQVAKMHEQADEIMTEGLWSGAGQMASGALTLTGGAAGLADSNIDRGQLTSRAFEGAGKIAEGGGTLGAAVASSDQKELEAEITGIEADRGVAERRAEEAQDEMDAAGDDLRTLLGRIEGIRNAEIAAEQAAIFRA